MKTYVTSDNITLVEITTGTGFAQIKAVLFLAVFGIGSFFLSNFAVANSITSTSAQDCQCECSSGPKTEDTSVMGTADSTIATPISLATLIFITAITASACLLGKKKLNEKMWAAL